MNTEDGKRGIENAGHPCVHLCTDFQEYETLLAVTMGWVEGHVAPFASPVQWLPVGRQT